MVGALVRLATVPENWRTLPTWQHGPRGVQGFVPNVAADGPTSVAMVIRVGDPQPPEVDGDDEPPAADDGQPLAQCVAAWLVRVPVGPGGRVAALTVLVEGVGLAETVAPMVPVQIGSLPRLHRSPASEAIHLPGFEVLPAAPAGRQRELPGFDAFVSGVPSWVLSLYDATGAKSMQRGRGAPWSLRLFTFACLHVPVSERTGGVVRLPLRLRDIEAWLWPDGWRRQNRYRDWQAFRTVLLRLGAIRPTIVGPDGRAYLVEIVRVPVVPRQWDPNAICPFFVTIPRSAAAGARVDWPALRRYGAESAPLFRAALASAAVLDYSSRRGQAITPTIAAPILDVDGKPKRRRGGKVRRDPDVRVVNPAARYVGKLTDADLCRMIGLTDHRQNKKRARAAFERLDADDGINLVRLPDGCVQLFGSKGETGGGGR